MKTTEYSVQEIQSLLKTMSGMYDLARVVDPIECRILEIEGDGKIRRNESCYGIWNAQQRCINCSSALACKTGCHQEKSEQFEDRIFHIQSNPVRLRLPDGGTCDAVVELVSIEKNKLPANDRAAENTDHRAAQYLAVHDPLTRALNAGAFYEFARGRIVRGPDTSWVMATANIMDFRLVNTLFGVLTGLVEKYGVDSSRLSLEITETALLEEPEKSAAVIARLRDRGFCVEIDDFGKGFSALRTLKDIQADVLKIDISLLHEIEQKQRSRIILESVIRMANSLDMDVVTEGVETEGQLRSLSAMGCRHFQGFLFSRPLPVAEFERMLAPAG